jgi:hypothetical protein
MLSRKSKMKKMQDAANQMVRVSVDLDQITHTGPTGSRLVDLGQAVQDRNPQSSPGHRMQCGFLRKCRAVTPAQFLAGKTSVESALRF